MPVTSTPKFIPNKVFLYFAPDDTIVGLGPTTLNHPGRGWLNVAIARTPG